MNGFPLTRDEMSLQRSAMRLVLGGLLLCSALGLADAPSARPPPSPTSENSRLAGEYFIQKSGATWVYQMAKKDKARWSINSFVEWRASFSFSLGKRSGGGQWYVRDGTWIERSSARSDQEAVVLPGVMSRGTHWVAPASIEKGGSGQSQFEVLALDAQVELPTGMTVEHCLAVIETGQDGSNPYTHYYAPNVGKVAVKMADEWLYRLVEFRAGARGHAE